MSSRQSSASPQVIDYGSVDHSGPVAWSTAARQEIEAIVARYPDRRSATLPVLWLAAREFGWISHQVETIIAEVLKRPLDEIHEVVTFYTMFPRRAQGRHRIEVCRNISCWLAGAVNLQDYLKDKLGIGFGETTADGKFTLSEVECLAYCECAPALRFDDRYVGNLTRESIDRLLVEAE